MVPLQGCLRIVSTSRRGVTSEQWRGTVSTSHPGPHRARHCRTDPCPGLLSSYPNHISVKVKMGPLTSSLRRRRYTFLLQHIVAISCLASMNYYTWQKRLQRRNWSPGGTEGRDRRWSRNYLCRMVPVALRRLGEFLCLAKSSQKHSAWMPALRGTMIAKRAIHRVLSRKGF
jgi:hypothetical protein